MPKSEKFQQLPAPWDRIFSLSTRIFVWALLAAIVYLLRPFFLLIFLTFVFAYIQAHGVDGLRHRFQNRIYRVCLVLFVFLGLIIGTFYFIAPHVKEQAGDFIRNAPRHMAQADAAIYSILDDYPTLKRFVEKPKDKKAIEDGEKPIGPTKPQDKPEPKDDPEAAANPSTGPPLGPDGRPKIVEPFVDGILEGFFDGNLQGVIAAGTGILGVTSSFLLSILFSFLIVLDLPKLSRMVASMADTKLDFIYEEVSENIYLFGKRLGRTLEAQVFIAIANTILTSIGIWILGIPNITFLASIVFFCSFIPVAGVFVSSAPICLMALQSGGDSGIKLALLAIVMILLVHTIEAYILNPKIYGHHLRMNAVLVLIILTIGGKLFGVWGLVLGLPVTNYFFAIAIQNDPADAAKDDAPPPDSSDAPKPPQAAEPVQG